MNAVDTNVCVYALDADVAKQLQMTQSGFNRLLDVGWYPEGDLVEGQYVLVVHEGDFNGRSLHKVETRERLALVAEIERILTAVCNGEL